MPAAIISETILERNIAILLFLFLFCVDAGQTLHPQWSLAEILAETAVERPSTPLPPV
ncbi:MAG: hypothetical protein J0H49_32080 [Acidobacteria bacterium]|nr:hypothetical protein [Acidobacteriota bacterium]